MIDANILTDLFRSNERMEHLIALAATANAMTDAEAAVLLKVMVHAERFVRRRMPPAPPAPTHSVVTREQAIGMDSTLTFNYREQP